MSPPAGLSSGDEDALADLVERALEELRAGRAVDPDRLSEGRPALARKLRDLLPSLAALVEVGRSAEGVPVALGDFRLLEEIGRGGMGVVYKAVQESLGRTVAVKILPFAPAARPSHLERFENEARALARLHHTHIVPIYAVGRDRGIHYYAMQYIEGRSLAQHIEHLRLLTAPGASRPGPLSAVSDSDRSVRTAAHAREVARIGLQAAEALAHAHGMGVIHRDVKPSNLLLDAKGAVWVTDFGLAQCRGEPGLTASGEILGTLRYMSPEQAAGRRQFLDERTDVYSLGATLYELATLRPACAAESPEAILQDVASPEEPPRPSSLNPSLPADLETVILKAIAKDPDDRYATAYAMAEDLRRFLEDRPILARRPSLLQRVVRWSRRHKGVVSVAAAALGVFAVAGPLVAIREAALRTTAVEERSAAQAALSRESAERARATRERDEKVAALARSESLRLAAHAASALESDPALSLLLGMEAAAKAPGPAGETVLRRALDELREHRAIPLPEGPATLDFSADGALLLSCNRDARLWDAKTGTLLRVLPVTSYCNGAQFSPDGRRVLTVETSGQLRIWDASTGRPIAHAGGPGAPDGVKFVTLWTSEGVFSPDGLLLAAPWGTRAAVLEVESGRAARFFEGHAKRVLGACFSSDGRRAATWSEDQTVRIWDVATAAPVAVLEGLRGRVDPAGLTQQGQPVLQIPEQVRFSADGRRVAVTSRAGTSVWNVAPAAVAFDLGPGADAVRFSPDGLRLLVRSKGPDGRPVPIHDVESGKLLATLRGHRDRVDEALFSRHGRRVLTASADGTARLWDVATSTEVAVFGGHGGPVGSAALSPDGARVATSSAQAIRLWHVEKGAERASLFGDANRPRVVALDPSGSRVAATSDPSAAQIWDVREARKLWEVRPASDLQLSADGRLVCGLDGPGKVALWDAQTGEVRARMTVHGDVETLALAPSGDAVALVDSDGRLMAWMKGAQAPAAVARLGTSSYAAPPVFAPDGTWVAALDGERSVAVLDWPSLERRASLEGHTDAIYSLQGSPDGRRLTTTARDGTARVWPIAGGPAALVIPTEVWLKPPAISRDGRSLALLTARSGRIRAERWDLQTGTRQGSAEREGGMFWNGDFSPEADRVVFVSAATGIFVHSLAGSGPPVELALPVRASRGHFFPDGRRILLLGEGASVADIETGRIVAGPMADVGQLRLDGLSPDGRLALLGVWHNGVAIRDTAGGSGVFIEGHGGQIAGLAYSPDGRRLATASYDRSTRIWDVVTGDRLHTLRHEARVRRVEFSGDGAAILTMTDDGAAHRWEVESGRRQDSWGGPAAPVSSAEFWPGTRDVLAVFGDGRLRRLGVSGEDLAIGPAPVRLARPSPDGKRLLLVPGTPVPLPGGQRAAAEPGPADPAALVWDVGERKAVHRLEHDGPPTEAAFLGNGERILTGTTAYGTGGARIWTARVWDAASGRELARLRDPAEGGRGWPAALGLSPDGLLGFLGTTSGGDLIDLATGARRSSLVHADGWIHGGFASDGRSLVSASTKGRVQVHPLDVGSAARAAAPRDLTADERDRFEVGTEEERRVARAREERTLIARELEAALDALRREPAVPGAPRYAKYALVSYARRRTPGLWSRAMPGLPEIRAETASWPSDDPAFTRLVAAVLEALER